MDEYDVLVIGSGSGLNIASRAAENGLEVAIVDKDPIGGTCLNRGCIPSKTVIYPAELIREVSDSEKLGVNFSSLEVDFSKIMERARRIYLNDREQMREGINESPNIDFFNDIGRFVSEYTLEVYGKKIRADKIFLFSGARPLVSPVEGIEDIDYLTNRNIFDLEEKPESLIIIGGGYIASEFAHFFSAVGTDVTVLTRSRILSDHNSEISDLLEKEFSSRFDLKTYCEAVEVGEKDGEKYVVGEDTQSGDEIEVSGESILVAIGRRSNADLLEVENTGVETDDKGWIRTNDLLETTKENIWAGGDATGRYMFRHVANYDASIVWHNAFSDHNVSVDYHAVPCVVFTYPQIASVGLTLEEAKKNHEVLAAKSYYSETARGYAMGEEEGFCKILIEKESGKILGAHIIGSDASILIQEIVNLMNARDGTIDPLYDSMHPHPALSEVVSRSLGNIEEV